MVGKGGDGAKGPFLQGHQPQGPGHKAEIQAPMEES